jgi:hypothetical protein
MNRDYSAVATSIREQQFERLYELAFPGVAKFISLLSGSLQEAKDVFQDALIIYYERTEDSTFSISVPPERYILGIAKHLWIRKYKIDRRSVSLDNLEEAITLPPDFFPTPNSIRLLRVLEATGKKCLDLLRSFYFQKENIASITGTFGFTTPHAASVQKYKCLEKVKKVIKGKSITYEDFFE